MDNTKAANILSYAMDMELEGERFFAEKAGLFVNPTTKKLFENLSKIEHDHYNYVKRKRPLFRGLRALRRGRGYPEAG